MANKYYAVRKGKTPGIYFSWEDCKTQVHGVKDAEYKKFSTLEEAKQFIQGKSVEDVSLTHQEIPLTPGIMIAYVDGSYLTTKEAFSYGAVILSHENTREISKAFYNHPDCALRNVAGEVMGAMAVMDIAVQEHFSTCHIYYDYAGIEKWAKKKWKTNRNLTRRYQDFFQEKNASCEFIFHKVLAHSGVEYNERADKLAKQALNIVEGEINV